MKKRVQIIVDDREHRSGVIEALQHYDHVDIVVKRLSLGDYQIDHRLLFERKTLLDLAVSIKDGRLFRQAHRLASSSLKSIMILEGTSSDLSGCGMTRECIQGALICLNLRFGIPVIRALNPTESAKLMLFASTQITLNPNRSFPLYRYHPITKRKRQLYMLRGFQGVGNKKALRLLNHFGSIEAIVTAGEDELKLVQGIGNRIADGIRNTVKETPVYNIV